mmetsp:Transcript_16255/g.28809  ORF Transcript_16255/g.28809 Transcript_16255/m.28809 type:complete len:104 (+) Transcript_16255:93-404(+)|eukprot:CAMPEP_0184540712 /NCGR_PEP_ID=MMETSP0199_2-20130426/881_1 /TAXON_ID=1112570 /ORGANISM="Thraustochytrium sp., Strain LLF1b" /LENGTH=103 /DNA_ID=CAMNT_0026934355 /DNA_START=73 /DNA_END=384 /DNA_ORIENTATION=+
MSQIIKQVAKLYQRSVHRSLREYGLRYEDVIVAENPDLQRALQYLPAEERELRNRRIRRAVDLSFKHEALPADVQAVQEPGKEYLAPLMKEFKAIREERELYK